MFLLLPLRVLCPSLTAISTHPPWFEHSNNVWWEVKIVKRFIMHFTSFSCHFFPLRTKYPSQCPILWQPRHTFLPQFDRPSFIVL
jgi:hypothetical protein